MEENYYVSLKTQTDERHRIHQDGCPFIPGSGKRIFLGKFRSSKEAAEARVNYFSKSVICPFCSKENQDNRRQLMIPGIILKEGLVTTEMISPVRESALLCSVN